ncbi:SWIB/MDM2 domain-containing protein [Exophiala viscosa]|uniref:SWIB/MDM2 domain-containing protein n=1 Tax=Exophiala viscosa TaxID=2486360 RepID=A0AAN6IEZ1_9EURO|nr:SWIB/MDM2 domain-containing protein [Exophiala viscosa]
MSLPSDVRAKYIAIIDGILDGADLTTITRKDIIKGIQDKVEYDITPHKVAIKSLINERFDVINAKENGEATVIPSVEPTEPTPKTNGVHAITPNSPSSSPVKREAKNESVSDVADAPPKKKRKASVDADAAYAARLQAEEDARARPTRGGTTRKAGPAKKKKKTKKEKVTGSDDSDIDDEDKPQKPKRETGFHKPLNLSPALSNLLDGATQLSRPETTKRLWAYIKGNDLQDPSDKRFILCDSKMREVFRQDKVHMFTMTKLVSQQMYNPDE